jgi:hypothetical protein
MEIQAELLYLADHGLILILLVGLFLSGSKFLELALMLTNIGFFTEAELR